MGGRLLMHHCFTICCYLHYFDVFIVGFPQCKMQLISDMLEDRKQTKRKEKKTFKCLLFW